MCKKHQSAHSGTARRARRASGTSQSGEEASSLQTDARKARVPHADRPWSDRATVLPDLTRKLLSFATILWVANSQSCRKDARTNSLAVIPAVTADPESLLRIPRWFTQGRSTRRRSIGRHTSQPSELSGSRVAHTLTPPSASDRALD